MSNRKILTAIIVASVLVKLPFLSAPLLGHFGSYQLVGGMMAANMDWSFEGIFMPRILHRVGGEPGLHLLYYPFASFFSFALDNVFGGGLDLWGRIQAAFFAVLASICVYLFTKRLLPKRHTLIAVLIFSFSPMVLTGGVSFRNETAGLFFLAASLILIIKDRADRAFYSGLLMSLTLVARLHFIVALAGHAFFLLGHRRTIRNGLAFSAGLLLPAGFWFGFVYLLTTEPSNIYTSLYSQVGEGRIVVTEMLKSGEFYRRIASIITGPLLTPLILPFLLIGILKTDKKLLPVLFLFLGSLTLIFLLPQKVSDHPFYLIVAVPAASVLAARVIGDYWPRLGKKLKITLVLVFLLASMRYYIPPASSALRADAAVVSAGKEIRGLTDPGDVLIAASGQTTGLLYYSRRNGWPFDLKRLERPAQRQTYYQRKAETSYGDPVEWLEERRREGATHLAVMDKELLEKQEDFYDYIRRHFPAVPEARRAYLFDLREKKA